MFAGTETTARRRMRPVRSGAPGERAKWRSTGRDRGSACGLILLSARPDCCGPQRLAEARESSILSSFDRSKSPRADGRVERATSGFRIVGAAGVKDGSADRGAVVLLEFVGGDGTRSSTVYEQEAGRASHIAHRSEDSGRDGGAGARRPQDVEAPLRGSTGGVAIAGRADLGASRRTSRSRSISGSHGYSRSSDPWCCKKLRSTARWES